MYCGSYSRRARIRWSLLVRLRPGFCFDLAGSDVQLRALTVTTAIDNGATNENVGKVVWVVGSSFRNGVRLGSVVTCTCWSRTPS